MFIVNLAFEIFIEELRRNAGGGRSSIFRVWVKKSGVKRLYRDETFPARHAAVDRFNQLRRILNVPAQP